MTTAVPDLDFMSIDLDEERERRAASREVKATEFPIRFGGEVVATIPTELPLDVLAPLRRLDEEITLLLRSVMTMMNKSREEQERWDATSLVVDILAANPQLPTTVVEVIEDMCQRLLGEDGLAALMAKRPSKDDMAFLAKRLLSFYGFSLGESQPSSDSSTEEAADGGETSKPTLPTTTPESTSEASGDVPETPASSERDAS